MKKEIEMWLKVLTIVVWGLSTIVTCAGVWNYCPETFVKVLAGVLLCSNGYALYRLGKTIKPEELQNKE